MTQYAKAEHFGIVLDMRPGGAGIVRIFNPDYEVEFDFHHVAAHEMMFKIKKSEQNISTEKNGMTLLDVARLLKIYGGALT